MIKVTVQETASRLSARAEREFDDLSENMWRVAEAGAAALRAGDSYTDRTGDLRASTEATLDESGDEVTVTLQMGMPYASYVERLGFSDFEEVAEKTEQQMTRGLLAMRDKLSR